MINIERINNPKDIIEESNAAGRIIAHLSGAPIIETSGNADHQIKPLSVAFKVELSENGGDRVFINITQPDRHHPSLVYPTIVNMLGMLPEFNNAILKPLTPEQAYDADSGVITVAYDLPMGGADHLIHDLSENFQHKVDIGWANKFSKSQDTLPPPLEEAGGWLGRLMQIFKPELSR